jgi:hypothetical protein
LDIERRVAIDSDMDAVIALARISHSFRFHQILCHTQRTVDMPRCYDLSATYAAGRTPHPRKLWPSTRHVASLADLDLERDIFNGTVSGIFQVTNKIFSDAAVSWKSLGLYDIIFKG